MNTVFSLKYHILSTNTVFFPLKIPSLEHTHWLFLCNVCHHAWQHIINCSVNRRHCVYFRSLQRDEDSTNEDSPYKHFLALMNNCRIFLCSSHKGSRKLSAKAKTPLDLPTEGKQQMTALKLFKAFGERQRTSSPMLIPTQQEERANNCT